MIIKLYVVENAKSINEGNEFESFKQVVSLFFCATKVSKCL